MTALAFLPIDINIGDIDEEKLLRWFYDHRLEGNDYWECKEARHIWAMISTCRQPKNWRLYDDEMWSNRRIEGINEGIIFHPGFEDEFPVLADCIRQLPFKQLTVSGMLYQLGEIPPHQDTQDPHCPTEPRRYTIYLTNPENNTFYFSKTKDSEKIYPTINKDYRCFVFNNTDVWHGASLTHRPKIILTMAGIIDNEKHEELLNRSLEKFKDQALYI
jgi:hypothetical protein